MVSIDNLLNDFKSTYGNKISIEESTLDVTDCFFSKDLNDFKAPKSFGDLKKNKVILYVVYGAPFLKKYKKDGDGKLVYDNGKFMPIEMEGDYKVLACLCLRETRNVSLHEIYDAIYPKNKVEVQGVRRWALRNILKKIQQKYPHFNVHKDTAFIFAGEENTTSKKIELNKIWLNQFLKMGKKSMSILEDREKELILEIFKDTVNDYHGSAYKFRGIIISETADFLKRKLDLVGKKI